MVATKPPTTEEILDKVKRCQMPNDLPSLIAWLLTVLVNQTTAGTVTLLPEAGGNRLLIIDANGVPTGGKIDIIFDP